MSNNHKSMTVVVGGRGKTGRRVADRLRGLDVPVRAVSPSGEVPFDWNDEASWAPALAGASALYLTYYPDLAVPGAAEHVRRLCRLAVDDGVERIVLLAGRGEPQVHPAEDAVRESGAAWTILESAFFMQNFSEGALAPLDGAVVFPAGDVREPFIDCEDIADVAIAALTDDVHAGATYELTGARLMTFEEATAEFARALRRPLSYVPVTFEQYALELAQHLPPPMVELFIDLFRKLLDGHNAHVTGDVERVLGRAPRDFREFAHAAAETAP